MLSHLIIIIISFTVIKDTNKYNEFVIAFVGFCDMTRQIGHKRPSEL